MANKICYQGRHIDPWDFCFCAEDCVFHVWTDCGDQLLPEDIAEGYIDYFSYNKYDIGVIGVPDHEPELLMAEEDGLVLLKWSYDDLGVDGVIQELLRIEHPTAKTYKIIG